MRVPNGCQSVDHPRLPRRAVVQVGGLTLLGAHLTDLLRLERDAVAAPEGRRAAKSLVFIFQSGGPSQYETFDPKPDAPVGIRGEYGTTATRLPGVRFCEYLPKLADRADRFAIVRSMHHVADRQFRNEHDSSRYMVTTGRNEIPIGDTNATIGQPRVGRFLWPSIGSLLSFAVTSKSSQGLPPFIEIPRTKLMYYPGRGSGVLGPSFEPWGVDVAQPCHAPDAAGSCPNCFSHDDPNDPARAPGKGAKAWWDNSSCRDATFRLPELGTLSITSDQLQNRAELLKQLDRVRRQADGVALRGETDTDTSLRWSGLFQRALDLVLLSRPGRENPFDLSQEDDRVRDLYGREEWGQGFLLARRLVEHGARVVQVNLRGWDTHQNAFRDLKGKLLPSLDHCLSGFLDDLHARGLLESTLVVMCGEMGRTPRISPISNAGTNASGEPFTPGRHHWGDVFPCFFAGGGIRGGQIIGESDQNGGTPKGTGYTPADLAATIFHAMGIGPESHFQDQEGRPYKMTQGNVIAPLF